MFEGRGRGTAQPDPSDEATLLGALANGHEDAMGALYQHHGALIYRFSLRMVQDESIAEEITQEVFLALLRQARQFDPALGKLSTWLCGIARRLVWKHLERTRRLELIDDANDTRASESAVVVLCRQEAIAIVQLGIARLPPHLKAVVVLCELEEMSYEEAAAALDVPVGTIRSRLHRARQRLAGLLQAEHKGREAPHES